jgi:hypothetical protein
MFKLPNSLRLPVLLVRERMSNKGLLPLPFFGLVGLGDRSCTEPLELFRPTGAASEGMGEAWDEDKFGTDGTESFGDCVCKVYLEVFLRTTRGGEVLRAVGVGVELAASNSGGR